MNKAGWSLLIRQPDLDRNHQHAWLAKHPAYQYTVTVWVDEAGNVTPESQPTYVD